MYFSFFLNESFHLYYILHNQRHMYIIAFVSECDFFQVGSSRISPPQPLELFGCFFINSEMTTLTHVLEGVVWCFSFAGPNEGYFRW